MATLLTFEDHQTEDSVYIVMSEEWALMQPGDIPAIDEVSDGDPIIAHANHGRWIVECPECGYGATRYSSATPLFICTACGDTEWTRVELHADHQDIADVLLERLLKNRHWLHTEDVEKLISENEANNVKVPDHLKKEREEGTE